MSKTVKEMIIRDYQSQVRPLFHPLVPKANKLATIRAFTSKAGVSRPTFGSVTRVAQLVANEFAAQGETLDLAAMPVAAPPVRSLPKAPSRPAPSGIPADALSERIDRFLASRGIAPPPGRTEPAAVRTDPSLRSGSEGEIGETPADFLCEDDVRADVAQRRVLCRIVRKDWPDQPEDRPYALEPAADVAPRMIHPVIGWSIERLLMHLNAAKDELEGG